MGALALAATVLLTAPSLAAPGHVVPPDEAARPDEAALPGEAPDEVTCSALLAQQGNVGTVVFSVPRIESDLVVDTFCQLRVTIVTGDVRLAAGTQVQLLDGVRVLGSVRSESRTAPARADVTGGAAVVGDVRVESAAIIDAHVGGSVVLDGPDAVNLAHSHVVDSRVGGSVRVVARGATVLRSPVGGSVHLAASETARVRGVTAGGDVTLVGPGRAVVHDVAVGGALSVVSARDVLVCRAGVTGDLTVRSTRMWTRVGEEGTFPCRTTVGGSVLVADHRSTVVLGELHVAGDLTCVNTTGSQGVVRRPGLVVDGERLGACA